MELNISTTKNVFIGIWCLLLLTLAGCKKADDFYGTLQALPQIMNTPAYAYKTTYIVGDTLVITGKLQPQSQDFSVSIGGITAKIAKIGSVQVEGTPRDQVSVLIAAEMAGQSREVKVSSGGFSTLGADIDVFEQGGDNSFSAVLSNRLVTNFSDNANIFLHCLNGKGDVFYFSPAAKKLYQVKKDGSQKELFNLGLAIQPGNIAIDEFIAGGVNSAGQQLYFSAKTTAGDYLFARIDLSNNTVVMLNRSAAIAVPYEGNTENARMVVTGVYPDEKGNVYLGIGFNTGRTGGYIPGAIALYQNSSNSIKYLFKDFNFSKVYNGMPGTDLDFSYLTEFRFDPSENLLYLMQASFLGPESTSIEVYDLLSSRKIQTLTANTARGESAYDVVTTFPALGISLAFNTPETSYGYLPMPGRRLQVLMYQEIQGSADMAKAKGFPRWIVLDFLGQRTYAYAQDRYRSGSYSFKKAGQRKDELLNYDEDGHLFTTANGLTKLIATRPL